MKDSLKLVLIKVLVESDDVILNKAILKSVHDNFIELLGDIALNILEEVIELSPYYLGRLRPHEDTLSLLSSSRVKGRRRRMICYKECDVITLMLRAVQDDLVEKFGGST